MKLLRWFALFAAICGVVGALACSSTGSAPPAVPSPPVGSWGSSGDGFALIHQGHPVAVVTDATADPAVRRVAESFAADLERIGGTKPPVVTDPSGLNKPAVVIGVLGDSPLLDHLIQTEKLNLPDLAGKWEAFHISVVNNPWPGMAQAMVVVGSDRRGAIYGTYDISEELGVSPWHWFADVPVELRSSASVAEGPRTDQPKVRYRGFFINDEDPALGGWAKKHFGGVNAAMYEHVFELLLRLKGNYLWPAMWTPRAFHLDDPRNTALADDMGVVLGASHHEPMTRAQSEWHRDPSNPNTGGAWNYATNAKNLREFWRGGIERMMSKEGGQGYEALVTVGMRGDGDAPMAEGTAIQLLETIVADQRRILEEVTQKPAAQTPQVWALYKEVQDYYDQGMTVPEDVTLLFSDDNWGQIRRLPTAGPERSGGYGVYYHFDYVGGPRNYKWLNTVQIEKVWQQMNLAYERDARNIWVVNVGDIKPMEYPLDFFMKMAWDPDAMTPQALADFPENWAKATFGPELASQIGELMTRYSRYAARRKPELINESTFPIGAVTPTALHPGELGGYVTEWRTLVEDTMRAKTRLRPEQQDAFYQLIEFPISALANLYELYYATAWNRRLASSHDARANYFIGKAEAAFARDAMLTQDYHSLRDGKWDGMMSQVHMNYVIWNEPTQQTLPPLTHVAADKPVEKQNVEVVFASPQTNNSKHLLLEASSFSRAIGGAGLEWQTIPHLGQSNAAVLAFPQGKPSTTIEDGVRLQYTLSTQSPGDWTVQLHLTPTLDTTAKGGIRIGVSLDGGAVQTLNAHLVPTAGAARTPEQKAWVEAVIHNGHSVRAAFAGVATGEHTLEIWRLDDNAILERLEVLVR